MKSPLSRGQKFGHQICLAADRADANAFRASTTQLVAPRDALTANMAGSDIPVQLLAAGIKGTPVRFRRFQVATRYRRTGELEKSSASSGAMHTNTAGCSADALVQSDRSSINGTSKKVSVDAPRA